MSLRPGWQPASESYDIVRTAAEDMALVHFTSGTTGRPKGAVHVDEAVVAHHITGRLVLDLHPRMMCSGARPTPDGSQAPPTASSLRLPTVRR